MPTFLSTSLAAWRKDATFSTVTPTANASIAKQPQCFNMSSKPFVLAVAFPALLLLFVIAHGCLLALQKCGHSEQYELLTDLVTSSEHGAQLETARATL